MFMSSIKKTLAVIALSACVFTAQAGIINNNDYTTDTDQGLDFLDINIFSDNTDAFFRSGVSFDGRTWGLASRDELDKLFSGITGETVSTYNEHNFAPGGARAVLDLVAGTTVDSSDWLHGSGGMILIHTRFNDTHAAPTGTRTNAGAWLVTKSLPRASVPEPSTLAIFALGMMGLVSRKFKKQS